MISVVGLGVEKGDLTNRGKDAILSAIKDGKTVVARTAFTKSYENLTSLGVQYVCLDDVYQKSRSFSSLHKNLAAAVLAFGDGTVYCVDGSCTEDNSVKVLQKKLRGKINIVDGVSKISALVQAAAFEDCSYTAVSAYELEEKAKCGLTTPLIVYDVDDRALASDVKLILSNLFGDETQIKFLGEKSAKNIPMYEMDRQKDYTYLTAVAIEKKDVVQKTRFTLADLQEIIVRLRAPDGCPWDRVQTPESIKMDVIEEAYELVDAIDSKDDEKLLEETGDILLQAVFHAVMKEETGAFNLTDVISGICQKLISRHTHVFGQDTAADETGALGVWDQNKMKEKNQVTFGDSVNDVPKCFPAALRAQKVGKRAAKAGMDFMDVEDAKKRLVEEIAEFESAYNLGDKENAEKEIGDVLFAVVNVARKAGIDAEKALKESTEKFAARFTLAEKLALGDGKVVTQLSYEEWDKYYLKAKAQLKDKKCN